MTSQGEALREIILDDFTSCRHRRQGDLRFDRFRAELLIALVRCREEGKLGVAQSLDLPECIPAIEAQGPESIGLCQALEGGDVQFCPKPEILD